ncbi:hypothetical protein JQU17_20405 [Ponticoccus sp. SC2-23]|uniref:hypothetical protein n=1 Tax=Alexandriicola marinus TaxID=2081710 RepID=UPI000FDA90E8|nr:hypothetical protein [Alexandriicola marinus]MBM1222579.1 hypothetical protein [Ponticoccus sp. SC6-9]MBM1227084.1 hypothetical protein [Ponticoccus sp. SC6-15]MBM1231505.1 hypothetical protein [Ponticoccus sp. SC6-38]MBM1236059.1 hypothetical protein [Ponticoccus sp. SC6-45]MBM1240528.1 hypothetical protein [Ponticoccus sp. SC6-49]MBM1245063.1 hypothetical protein [Ponticoccus sp. SC2-64]MBM1249533.1 hypothetical protein [Ponticoccus sp. SC6-42]MBM1254021.1 hypothetical protein [Pontico
MRRVWGLALAAAAILLAGQLGLFARLGAHPFWSDFTAPALGILVGAAGYCLGLWRRRTGLITMIVLLVAAAAAARFGKQVFAASYAENALAGDFWFFGWIALCGALVALVGLMLDRSVFDRRDA